MAVWFWRAVAIAPVGLNVPAPTWVDPLDGRAVGDPAVAVGWPAAATRADSPGPLTAAIHQQVSPPPTAIGSKIEMLRAPGVVSSLTVASAATVRQLALGSSPVPAQ